jgi:predicted nucleotide-binding protein
MQKTKSYTNVFLRPEHLAEIAREFRLRVDEKARDNLKLIMSVYLSEESWDHVHEEEFFSDIRKNPKSYSYHLLNPPYDLAIDYRQREKTRAAVSAKARKDIEGVFHVIDRLAAQAEVPLPLDDAEHPGRPVKIFVGHGQNMQWRDLKDHLHEKHGYAVEAYEIGARAGHAIRDVLEDMLESTSMAFLVMTGEDDTPAGGLRARQNVIHEIGLFQGRLGFAKAVVLMEAGVEEFSNIHGIQQIRFAKGGIRETFGDVLATIRREFPDDVTNNPLQRTRKRHAAGTVTSP